MQGVMRKSSSVQDKVKQDECCVRLVCCHFISLAIPSRYSAHFVSRLELPRRVTWLFLSPTSGKDTFIPNTSNMNFMFFPLGPIILVWRCQSMVTKGYLCPPYLPHPKSFPHQLLLHWAFPQYEWCWDQGPYEHIIMWLGYNNGSFGHISDFAYMCSSLSNNLTMV